jgi:hypothetical protein
VKQTFETFVTKVRQHLRVLHILGFRVDSLWMLPEQNGSRQVHVFVKDSEEPIVWEEKMR